MFIIQNLVAIFLRTIILLKVVQFLPFCCFSFAFHEFTLNTHTYNKLSKGLCIFGVLSDERAPSSAFSPDPECSPECSSPCWGRNGLKVRSRVVEGLWKTRDNEGKTALIIYRDSLSCWLDRWCDYWWWIGRVNYLRVLLLKLVNKTSLSGNWNEQAMHEVITVTLRHRFLLKGVNTYPKTWHILILILWESVYTFIYKK